MVYVLQYWLYFVPVRALHIERSYGLWALVLLSSIPFLWWAAFQWDRHGTNRFYTLGLRLRPRTGTSVPLT
jgi:hypothetical protein